MREGTWSIIMLYVFTDTPFPAFPIFQCLKVRQSSLQSSHQHHSAMEGTWAVHVATPGRN